MSNSLIGDRSDAWSQWLLRDRFGGDQQLEQRYRRGLQAIRDRILRRAQVEASSVVLDVGCGDGLLGFGALEKVGLQGKVIFTDSSSELVEHCRKAALREGVASRCEFVVSDAQTLKPIADNSIDVIVSRAVLMYLKDRESAFRAFYRVLKPGGRLSICEPVNRIGYQGQPDLLRGTNFEAVADLKKRIDAYYEDEYPDDPTRNFDADDLLNLAEAAEFRTLETWRWDYSIPTPARNWEAILKTPPFAGMSTLERVLETFSPEDRERFDRNVRPQVGCGGIGGMRAADAYLIARK
jgi:SAM-dependent methyltransferase